MKKFEIPIPFKIEEWDDGIIYFDYRFSSLAKNDKILYELMKNMPREGNNKFYNRIMEIEVLTEIDGEKNEG